MKRKVFLFFIIVFIFMAYFVKAELTIDGGALIRPVGLGSQAQFGTSVALGEDYAFIGAPGHLTTNVAGNGTVFVAKREVGWAITQKLIATDGASGHRFGSSVAIDGNWAVVGASGAEAVYVYELVGSIWTFRQKLVASPNNPGSIFGSSVAISGTKIVVGAYGSNSYSGRVYVFNYDGFQWAQTQILSVADGATYDFFGYVLAISDNTLVVGAYGDDETGGTNFGSTYLFYFDGELWNYGQKLKAPDGGSGDNFGESVDIDGSTLVIGASRDDDKGSNAGAAYVFNGVSDQWNFQSKLAGSDSHAGDWFGSSVGVNGNLIVAGSPLWDDTNGVTNRGTLYPFIFDGSSWLEQDKLLPPTPWGSYDDNFGNSVTLTSENILGGAKLADWQGRDAGDVYIYELTYSEGCMQDLDCNDNIACTTDVCNVGTCLHSPQHDLCNDGAFCNGAESCNTLNGCVAGTSPCGAGQTCNEGMDSCQSACNTDADTVPYGDCDGEIESNEITNYIEGYYSGNVNIEELSSVLDAYM